MNKLVGDGVFIAVACLIGILVCVFIVNPQMDKNINQSCEALPIENNTMISGITINCTMNEPNFVWGSVPNASG